MTDKEFEAAQKAVDEWKKEQFKIEELHRFQKYMIDHDADMTVGFVSSHAWQKVPDDIRQRLRDEAVRMCADCAGAAVVRQQAIKIE